MKSFRLLALVLTLLATTALLFSCGGECEHEWDDGAITKAPTCILNGIITYTCKRCGETEKSATDPTGHTNTVLSATDATCTTEGTRRVRCTVCDTESDEVIPKSEHDFSVLMSSTEPTCSIEGAKTYRCSTCDTTSKLTVEPTGSHVFHSTKEYIMIKSVPTATTPGVKVSYCKSCSLEREYPYSYTEYMTDRAYALQKLQAVDVSSFTTKKISTMNTSTYADPLAYPTKGEHPRLLINSSILEDIKAAILLPENAEFFNEVIRVANSYDSGILGEVEVHTAVTSRGPRGEHNLDENLYNCLMAKSFLYLLTGVETYAIDAIRMTKEFMSTIVIKSTAYDPERNWGYAMYTASIVYDWCYNAMSDQDKVDIARGIEWRICKTVITSNAFTQNMEIGFPPASQGAVVGHGCERQLLRDYLAAAIALYDEHPTWYEYIGGRFYQDYVPVRNEFYKAGMYPQGISVYIQIRFTGDVWSALLMNSAVGANPYTGDMTEVLKSYYCRVVDGGYTIFEEGDDEARTGENILSCVAFAGAALAYLYDDPTCMAWSEYMDYSGTEDEAKSWLYLLIFRSKGVRPAEDRYDDLDLICYNAGYLNEMVVHSDWSANAASVLMKIGTRTTANHDHGDSGSFQIYYKGILAGDTGYYDSYGSDHFKKYHQATIAHNSVVIYRNNTSIGQKNGSSYTEPKTYDAWMSDTYVTATLTGASYGYMDEAKTAPKYAYIAGDIAPAYQGAITKGDRRMLAVFDTENPDSPMYFFVYDNFTGTNSTDAMIFLLHTTSEPIIDGKTVTATAGEGKMVLQNIKGGDQLVAIGGEGNNYVVNGTHIENKDNYDDGFWGRVEISTQNSSKNDVQLNVIYVTDIANENTYTATEIVGANIAGSILGNTAAVFIEDSTEYSGEITFDTTGARESLNYYVSGVCAGEWAVAVGGTVFTVTVAEGEGLLSFTAPAGVVTITPVN